MTAVLTAPSHRPSTGTVRLLLLPSLVAVSLLALASVFPHDAEPVVNLLVQWVIYSLWGWWAVRSANALGLSCNGVLARPDDRRDWRFVLLAVPLLVLCVSALAVQSAMLLALLPAARAMLAADAADAPQPLVSSILMVLTGATLVPLVEELVFRGVLLRAWSVRFGERRAVIGTSLAFGLMHHDPIGAVVFGVVMALLYRRTGTLLIPVVTHAAYNFLTGISMLLPDGDSVGPADVPPVVPATLVLLACLLCVIAALRAPRRRASVATRA